jgi:hypothetical protein
LLLKKLKTFDFSKLALYFLKVSSAAVIMIGVLYLINIICPMNYARVFTFTGKIEEIALVAGQVLVGVAVFISAAVLFGIEEAETAFKAAKRRLIKCFKLFITRKKEKI